MTLGTPLFGARLSAETIYGIIRLAAEGLGARATARFLGIPKATVNQVILKVGEHCQNVLTGLMDSLQLTKAQMDEFWAFVKKTAFGEKERDAG
jgi:hypothetical protein